MTNIILCGGSDCGLLVEHLCQNRLNSKDLTPFIHCDEI